MLTQDDKGTRPGDMRNSMEESETMIKRIDGGITAPKGFLAAGLRAGIKPGKTNKDMAMIYSEVPATVAGTFTRNRVTAAPVQWDRKIVEEQETAQAVVVNTGIANAATGAEGLKNSELTAEEAGKVLRLPKEQVLVASTGVIGFQLPMDVILEGVSKLAPELSHSRQSALDAAEAILTTDTHKKEIAVEFTVGGVTCTMAGMSKGSGMIHPNMGTMLCFISTDAAIDKGLLQRKLREVVDETYNMVSVDGDTSTNDTVLVLANGKSGAPKIETEGGDLDSLTEALTEICTYLAKQTAQDGEGATRLFTAHVTGAPDRETARTLAKAIITSNLTKAAIFGKDANMGRLLCAMGYSGAEYDTSLVDVTMCSKAGSIKLVTGGCMPEFSEEEALRILEPEEITAEVELHQGEVEATAWGCDLTYDYVKINADYRS